MKFHTKRINAPPCLPRAPRAPSLFGEKSTKHDTPARKPRIPEHSKHPCADQRAQARTCDRHILHGLGIPAHSGHFYGTSATHPRNIRVRSGIPKHGPAPCDRHIPFTGHARTRSCSPRQANGHQTALPAIHWSVVVISQARRAFYRAAMVVQPAATGFSAERPAADSLPERMLVFLP